MQRTFPNAVGELGWQWAFPACQLTGIAAARRAGLSKWASGHPLRHSVAAHLLESGYDIRTVQELSGYGDVSTTMIYIHVLNRGGLGRRARPIRCRGSREKRVRWRTAFVGRYAA